MYRNIYCGTIYLFYQPTALIPLKPQPITKTSTALCSYASAFVVILLCALESSRIKVSNQFPAQLSRMPEVFVFPNQPPA